MWVWGILSLWLSSSSLLLASASSPFPFSSLPAILFLTVTSNGNNNNNNNNNKQQTHHVYPSVPDLTVNHHPSSSDKIPPGNHLKGQIIPGSEGKVGKAGTGQEAEGEGSGNGNSNSNGGDAESGGRSFFDLEKHFQQLHFAQKVVEEGRHSGPLVTVIAVKFQSATILLCLLSSHGSQHGRRALHQSSSNSPLPLDPPPLFENDNVLALPIGRLVDCQKVLTRCRQWERESGLRSKEQLTARGLALLLADRCHAQSMRPQARPLAQTTLLLDKQSTARAGDVFLVDVTGNYYFCRAGSFGLGCKEMSVWLEERGRALAQERLALRSQGGSLSENEECMRDLEDALFVAWECLLAAAPHKMLEDIRNKTLAVMPICCFLSPPTTGTGTGRGGEGQGRNGRRSREEETLSVHCRRATTSLLEDFLVEEESKNLPPQDHLPSATDMVEWWRSKGFPRLLSQEKKMEEHSSDGPAWFRLS
eukprot:scaffold2830_cov175-Ochromonas_danica.AAC.3